MPDAPEAQRSGRAVRLGFIALFLGFQLVMPLRYYLGGRGYDERFSWRMFSTLRLQACSMKVEEREAESAAWREVPVGRDVQVAWVNLLERVRRPVVEKYLLRRCERGPISEVLYTRNCTDTDGTILPPQQLALRCEERRLREVPR
jgi:hypothetical protein